MDPVKETKTLRDEFAMAALTGLIANAAMGELPYDTLSDTAYRQADSMLIQRKK